MKRRGRCIGGEAHGGAGAGESHGFQHRPGWNENWNPPRHTQ